MIYLLYPGEGFAYFRWMAEARPAHAGEGGCDFCFIDWVERINR